MKNIFLFLILILSSPVFALQKNVASQKWYVFAFDETDNTAKTGDAAQITANVRIDGGAADDVTDTNPTELEDGYYVFDITAGESNGDCIVICPDSSTSNIQVIGCPMAVWTTPPYFSTFSIDSNGRIDMIKVAGTTQTANDMSGDIDDVLIDTGTITSYSNFNDMFDGTKVSVADMFNDAITLSSLGDKVVVDIDANSVDLDTIISGIGGSPLAIGAGNLGDYKVNSTVYFIWRSVAKDGAAIDPSTAGTIKVYRNDSDVEITAPTGITDTRGFDGLTGIHLCSIDLSASSFYAKERDYSVVLTGATVDSEPVTSVISTYSIQKRWTEFPFIY